MDRNVATHPNTLLFSLIVLFGGDRGTESNEFIETTMISALTAILGLTNVQQFTERISNGLHITITGDNAFYSASESDTSGTMPWFSLQRYSFSQILLEPKKTGLGSSAALVSSLVGALMVHFGAITTTGRFFFTGIHHFAVHSDFNFSWRWCAAKVST